MKTSKQFDGFIDILVVSYINDYEENEDRSILEFLDREGVDKNVLVEINPMDVVRAMSQMDLKSGFTLRNGKFTPRCKILFGLAKELSYGDAKSRFGVGDIVYGESDTWVIIEDDNDAGWIARSPNTGNMVWIEYLDFPKYSKIGTASEDILKKLQMS